MFEHIESPINHLVRFQNLKKKLTYQLLIYYVSEQNTDYHVLPIKIELTKIQTRLSQLLYDTVYRLSLYRKSDFR
jgi:hypothetical protein